MGWGLLAAQLLQPTEKRLDALFLKGAVVDELDGGHAEDVGDIGDDPPIVTMGVRLGLEADDQGVQLGDEREATVEVSAEARRAELQKASGRSFGVEDDERLVGRVEHGDELGAGGGVLLLQVGAGLLDGSRDFARELVEDFLGRLAGALFVLGLEEVVLLRAVDGAIQSHLLAQQ